MGTYMIGRGACSTHESVVICRFCFSVVLSFLILGTSVLYARTITTTGNHSVASFTIHLDNMLHSTFQIYQQLSLPQVVGRNNQRQFPTMVNIPPVSEKRASWHTVLLWRILRRSMHSLANCFLSSPAANCKTFTSVFYKLYHNSNTTWDVNSQHHLKHHMSQMHTTNIVVCWISYSYAHLL